ncbi:hypothetical protein [Bacillus nitroreducens]
MTKTKPNNEVNKLTLRELVKKLQSLGVNASICKKPITERSLT